MGAISTKFLGSDLCIGWRVVLRPIWKNAVISDAVHYRTSALLTFYWHGPYASSCRRLSATVPPMVSIKSRPRSDLINALTTSSLAAHCTVTSLRPGLIGFDKVLRWFMPFWPIQISMLVSRHITDTAIQSLGDTELIMSTH